MKKITTLTLILTVILCLFGTIDSFAARSGNFTYTVSDGSATITDFDSTVSGDIIIPSTLGGYPVTSIGDSAFKDCKGLTSITIPDSVTSIKYEAFRNCYNLTSITIPDSVTSIATYAFENCYDLTSITIPDSVTFIPMRAFKNCSSLTSVTIPDSVTSIEYEAFYGTAIKKNNSNWENGIFYIGNHLIEASGAISGAYEIKDGTKTIAERAFYGCVLTSVTIPDSVTSIGSEAFYGCTGLTSITIPDSITSIGESMFKNCNGLTSVTIPDSVTSIGSEAFSGCSGLTSITIPDSVTSIGSHAFYGCKGLINITIPDSVTSIGWSMFYQCDALKEITLPFIGSQRGNSGNDAATFKYLFRYSSNSEYRYSVPTSLKKVTITDETFIGIGAFEGCSGLTDIIIEGNVKGIQSNAFANHENLVNITIKSENVKFADSSVFSGTAFATLYGYKGSTVEKYASENNIDFVEIIGEDKCELNGNIKNINNTLVVHIDINKTVTEESLYVFLYDENNIIIDYIVVPSDTPYNSMNVVFKGADQAAYAKVFLWEGYSTIAPLADSKKIEIE